MEEQNSNTLGDLFSSIKHYVDLRIDEIKLTLAENMAKILSRVIFFLLLFILIGIVLCSLVAWGYALIAPEAAAALGITLPDGIIRFAF